MIYLVRHGETDWNATHRVQGCHDIPLNANGESQALVAKGELQNKPIDLIISSPLQRAKRTAKIINEDRGVPIICDDRLKERCFGDMEGLSRNEFDFYNLWDFHLNMEYPNAERVQDFFKRVYGFFDEITEKYKNKNILVATHGGVAIAAYYYFSNVEIPNGTLIGKTPVPSNCEVVSYEI